MDHLHLDRSIKANGDQRQADISKIFADQAISFVRMKQPRLTGQPGLSKVHRAKNAKARLHPAHRYGCG